MWPYGETQSHLNVNEEEGGLSPGSHQHGSASDRGREKLELMSPSQLSHTSLHSLPAGTHFSSLLPSYPIRQHACLTRLTDGAVVATNVESISLTLTDSVEWI